MREPTFAAGRRLADDRRSLETLHRGSASLSNGLDIVRKTLGKHEIATVQTTAIDKEAGLTGRVSLASASQRDGGNRLNLGSMPGTGKPMPLSCWFGPGQTGAERSQNC